MRAVTFLIYPVGFLAGLTINLGSNAFCSERVDYLGEVKPLLARKCVSCHGALRQESGIRLDTAALIAEQEVITPGNATTSELIHRVRSIDPEVRMPPDGEPLTESDIKLLETWIEEGAKGPVDEMPQTNPNEHWAFQPLADFNLEANPKTLTVDHFISQKLSTLGLELSPEADPVILCRRLFFDLHGLPPTPEEIAFFTNQLKKNKESAISEQIQALLESPRYGERWAQHWLDLVRYADTHGFEVNTPRENAWPYRDYVIKSFNENKPYDQFIREQLAGDQLNQDSATGFLVAAPVLLPGQIGKDDASKRLARQDSLDEIIVGTSASFLGLTIGCARCHDHKFDPISQEDYYSLQAFFAGVQYGDRTYQADGQEERSKQINSISERVAGLEKELSAYHPESFTGATIIIDEEDSDRTTSLMKKNGVGTNPAGENRGYRDDPGDRSRFGNLSSGKYTWWDNVPNQDTFTWNPGVTGQFQIWISWGVHGSGVHTRDARYVLDHDGDLNTKEDQREIAVVDQYYFAGQTDGESEKKPLWSGLLNTGSHTLNSESRLVLRGGETGTGITADTIILQETESVERNLPSLRDPISAKSNIERFSKHEAKYLRFTTLETIDENQHQPCIDELEVYASGDHQSNLALAELGTKATSSGNYSETGKHQLKHINDGVYGNDRSWISNQHGGGWVQLELSKAAEIDQIVWGRDRNERFKDRLPTRYLIESSLDGKQWETIVTSEDRLPIGTPNDSAMLLAKNSAQLNQEEILKTLKDFQNLQKQLENLKKPTLVYAGTFKKAQPTQLLNRGDPEQPEHEVIPRTPTILTGIQLSEETNESDRRLALADWIASPKNPLTARVMANRIWQFHFGIGLVDTPSDFGINGSKPSHPKLLDWLAKELISSGWSINHLHQIILTSKTYRQSSIIKEKALSLDSDGRLFWRYPSRRLEGEAIRDSILLVSGNLNLATGGPGFNFFQSRGGLNGFPPLTEFTENEMRRTIYSHKIRMEPVPVFGAFDCPDAGQPTPKRSQSTTAIQALNLFNSDFIDHQTHTFAKRIRSGAGVNPEQQIDHAFHLALGRHPTKTESTACLQVVREHGLPTLCRVLFNSNEFLFLP